MTAAQIKKSKIFTPGIIGGSIVHFLSSEKQTFFIRHDGQDGYLKDDNRRYVKMTIDQVIEARQLYLTTYEEQEKEEAIQQEYRRLGRELVKKAQEIIKPIREFKMLQNEDYKGFELLFSEEEKAMHKRKAETFFKDIPNAIEIKKHLEQCIENSDYEALYDFIEFRFGKPLATFKNGENIDPTALINIFGAANIHTTITDLQTKGPLYLQAKITIEKTYHPEL